MAIVTVPEPTLVPGLPSPYELAGGMVYFPRMIAKIRLHAEGKLPEAYHAALGAAKTFDGRCARFLGVSYDAIKAQALASNASAEELLEWCFANGQRRSKEDLELWNSAMIKAGWRDQGRASLVRRLEEANLPLNGPILTMFDFIDVDEGRPLRQWD